MYCTRQTISNYENGKSEPNIALLVEIAKVLEVEVNDLIYGTKRRRTEEGRKLGRRLRLRRHVRCLWR